MILQCGHEIMFLRWWAALSWSKIQTNWAIWTKFGYVIGTYNYNISIQYKYNTALYNNRFSVLFGICHINCSYNWNGLLCQQCRCNISVIGMFGELGNLHIHTQHIYLWLVLCKFEEGGSHQNHSPTFKNPNWLRTQRLFNNKHCFGIACITKLF